MTAHHELCVWLALAGGFCAGTLWGAFGKVTYVLRFAMRKAG